MDLNTILNEDFKKNKKASKNLKKHWKEIQNIKDIDFGGLFLSFKIQHFHRQFSGTDVSFLAIFSAFEFLHNLNTLIDSINSERRMKAINKAAGMEICAILPNNNMSFSEVKKHRPFMIDYYKNRLKCLKKGKIDVRPEVWNYIFNGKNISDDEKKNIEKQAANETLRILTEPSNILNFIEKAIEGNII